MYGFFLFVNRIIHRDWLRQSSLGRWQAVVCGAWWRLRARRVSFWDLNPEPITWPGVGFGGQDITYTDDSPTETDSPAG